MVILKQAVIPLMLVGVIASIILPVPAPLMDFLLLSNLVLAVMLLISTLYISDPLKLSSLPTILLLATLYRLALNISSTRLILSKGDAGQAIEAFGSVVIGDNLVVGAVIFLIITLVQFIVIAKGSERVAEVSARFTLDAMPGKQMSIDADLRSGLIDTTGAKLKRQELQTESRFYGALDGAMKFVKGDAVAGIAICVINILGGLALGTLAHGLSLSEAAQRYSLLTIGDGLISQIPALLNALAAGLVVTRVTRGDDAPLATEVLTQLGQIRSVKHFLGGVCFLAAFVPMVPAVPVLLLSAALFLSTARPGAKPENVPPADSQFKPRIPPALQVQLSKELAQALVGVKRLSEQVDEWRQGVYQRWGLLLLRPELAPLSDSGSVYEIVVRGITVRREALSLSDSEGEKAQLFLNRIFQSLNSVIDEDAPEFVDDILTRRCLDNFDKEAPELVSAVVPAIVSVTQLTFILRSLVAEGLPISNFDLILQAIADGGRRGFSERQMLEEVRVSLKHIITQRFLDGGLRAVNLDPVVDLAVTNIERKGLLPDFDYSTVIACELEKFGKDAALFCSKSSRMLVKESLTLRGLPNPVYAYDEICSKTEISWAGSVSITDSASGEGFLQCVAA